MTCGNRIAEEEIHFLEENVGIWDLAFRDGLLVLDLYVKVTWDEPEVLQNVMRVSPWQVELVMPTPPFHTTPPPAKRFRIAQSPELPSDGEGEIFFPMADTVMGILNPSLLNHNTFPAGMQGARQDSFYVSSLSNLTSENTHQMCTINSLDDMATKLNTVSTELNIGSSLSDNLSPDSQGSVHFFGTKPVGNQDGNSSTKVGIHSFQLFGKVIHIKQPVEGNCSADGCTEDGSKKIQ
ncbi:Auxin response factor 17 [Vitis vinifera]|uniref:Auxin response factor 17 n=1 Tax=Vitis vinifera TaxID=29760 RepID=A0A438C9A3_VITVI|nr:Auxin response factor 17 [Vitis vinifera]